uniref:Uncharacterized protein n=1 Tax=Parascaris equorum TaxID=6256 RepID=A0A914R3G1_PAREQ
MLCKRGPSAAVDVLYKEILNVLNFFESSQIPLRKGLYLCYLKLHSTINTIRVVVPHNVPSMLPYVFIRENGHVSREEWEWLRLLTINASIKPLPAQRDFYNAIVSAASLLIRDLDIDSDLMPLQRLYRLQVFELNFGVSFILVVQYEQRKCLLESDAKIYDQLLVTLNEFHRRFVCPFS